MKQLDVSKIAAYLKKAADRYIRATVVDVTEGLIHSAFKRELKQHGLDHIYEIGHKLSSVRLARKQGKTILDDKLELIRILSPDFETDIMDIQVDPTRMATIITDLVRDYVRNIGYRRDVQCASRPILHLHVEAYKVSFFVYGYIGVIYGR